MEAEIGANESVSAAVIRAVSAVSGQNPGSLQPLAAVIDPDALDALFDPRANGLPRTGGRLSFNYSSCRITIDNGEFLTIEPFDSIGGHRPATERTPGSRVCFVCQQPIERGDLQRERGELVHPHCRAELRCGVSFEVTSER